MVVTGMRLTPEKAATLQQSPQRIGVASRRLHL